MVVAARVVAVCFRKLLLEVCMSDMFKADLKLTSALLKTKMARRKKKNVSKILSETFLYKETQISLAKFRFRYDR